MWLNFLPTLAMIDHAQRQLLTIMYKSQGGNSQYQHGSPHVPLKPSAKRSATPEHMLNDQVHNVTSFTILLSKLSKSPSIEMYQGGRWDEAAWASLKGGAQSPGVREQGGFQLTSTVIYVLRIVMFRNKTLKVRSMGGIATPLAGQMLPTVSSPGRQVPIN